MFITQAKEILEAVPTAKFGEKEAQKLLHYVEEEEDAMLEPLLGESLMHLLYSQYKALVAQYGSITTPALAVEDGTDDGMEEVSYTAPASTEGETSGTETASTMSIAAQQKTVKLLRMMQSALVYRMLSNKLYTLSTSLNLGGGANRASAGDYEPADDKHLQEVRKEYYMNSRRACDNILVILERDAKEQHTTTTTDEEGNDTTTTVSDSLWLTLWQESDGYYLKEDLLFPTLRSLKPYYPCNEPTKFLSLAPVIRYCQDTYITPRVDSTLIDKLLLVSARLTADEKKALKLLRTALAYYVRAKEAPRDERNEALMTADAAMSTATDFANSQFTIHDSQSDDQTSDSDCECKCCKEKTDNINANEYSTFSTLFAPGVNRW